MTHSATGQSNSHFTRALRKHTRFLNRVSSTGHRCASFNFCHLHIKLFSYSNGIPREDPGLIITCEPTMEVNSIHFFSVIQKSIISNERCVSWTWQWEIIFQHQSELGTVRIQTIWYLLKTNFAALKIHRRNLLTS